MKSKENDSVPIYFLAREQLKHAVSFCRWAYWVAPVLSWISALCNRKFVRRFLSTGAENETGINVILHWWKTDNDSNIPVS